MMRLSVIGVRRLDSGSFHLVSLSVSVRGRSLWSKIVPLLPEEEVILWLTTLRKEWSHEEEKWPWRLSHTQVPTIPHTLTHTQIKLVWLSRHWHVSHRGISLCKNFAPEWLHRGYDRAAWTISSSCGSFLFGFLRWLDVTNTSIFGGSRTATVFFLKT